MVFYLFICIQINRFKLNTNNMKLVEMKPIRYCSGCKCGGH